MRIGSTMLGALALGATVTLALAGRAAAAAEKAPPDLTGRWQLNAEESENARDKMREARERRGGPGGRPGAGGMGGGRPGGAGSDRGPDGGGPMGGVRELFEAPERLTITGNDGEMTVDDGQGGLLRLHLDGKARKREGGELETRARWKDGTLIVETTGEGRPRVTTTYALRKQARQLEVTTKLEGRFGEPVSVRRVYDVAPAE